MQKLKIGNILENLKNEIVTRIEDSKLAKENAFKHYENAKSKIEHIEEEISEKISLANRQADNVQGSIEEAAERKIKQIKNNILKVIEAEEKTLLTSLTEKTADKSIELAEKYIRRRLLEEPSLHNKYIDESIEEIDKVTV